jgi:hypothetical protein
MPGRYTPPPSRYLPIAQYLAIQEAEMVTLTLMQIETILGFPLPMTAYADGAWWRRPVHTQVRAWSALGWEARLLYKTPVVVVFTRTTGQEDEPVK